MFSLRTIQKARPSLARIATRSLATTATNNQQKVASTRGSSRFNKNGNKRQWNESLAVGAGLLGLAGAGAGVALMEAPPPTKPEVQATSKAIVSRDPIPDEAANAPPSRPDLPTIPLEEVAEHCDEDSLWYTFRGAVYDMTFFINGHPGGTPVSILNWRFVIFLDDEILFIVFSLFFNIFFCLLICL